MRSYGIGDQRRCSACQECARSCWRRRGQALAAVSGPESYSWYPTDAIILVELVCPNRSAGFSVIRRSFLRCRAAAHTVSVACQTDIVRYTGGMSVGRKIQLTKYASCAG